MTDYIIPITLWKLAYRPNISLTLNLFISPHLSSTDIFDHHLHFLRIFSSPQLLSTDIFDHYLHFLRIFSSPQLLSTDIFDHYPHFLRIRHNQKFIQSRNRQKVPQNLVAHKNSHKRLNSWESPKLNSFQLFHYNIDNLALNVDFLHDILTFNGNLYRWNSLCLSNC